MGAAKRAEEEKGDRVREGKGRGVNLLWMGGLRPSRKMVEINMKVND